MTKFFQTVIITACFLLTGVFTHAQENKLIYIRAVPEWVPSEGYWVVEGNKKNPRENTICFYNEENKLIYKETITGIRLKVKKERVKLHLKSVLETALMAWEQQQKTKENYGWVANELRKK